MATFYEVCFNNHTDTLAHVTRCFTHKAAAVRYANRLAKEKYVSFVQVWQGGFGGIRVHERHHAFYFKG